MKHIHIKFNTQYVFENSHDVAWHPKLISLLMWINCVTKFDLFIISVYPADSTTSLRGVDLKSKNKKESTKLINFINKYWQYDSKRPNIKIAMLEQDCIQLKVHNRTFIKKSGYQTDWMNKK